MIIIIQMSDAEESMVDMMSRSLTDLLNPASERESDDEEEEEMASVELSGETRGDTGSQIDFQVLIHADTDVMSVDAASVRAYVSENETDDPMYGTSVQGPASEVGVDKESSPPEDRHAREDDTIHDKGGTASELNHKSLQGNKGRSEKRKQSSLSSFFTLSSSTSQAASKKRRTTSPDRKTNLASRTEDNGQRDKDNG
jgi:hypothetical protein